MPPRDHVKVLELLEFLLELGDQPGMTVNMAKVLLAVATKPDGILLEEVRHLSGIKQSPLSQIIQYLGDKRPDMREGLRLLDFREAPRNRVKKVLFLTKRGKVLLKLVVEEGGLAEVVIPRWFLP